MMDRPVPPEPPANGDPVPLSFNLNQAAALCGVSVQQLQEWTDCGYVRVSGQGDRRRYDREALRQILAVRDAIQSGRLSGRTFPRGHNASGSPIRPRERREPTIRPDSRSEAHPESRRPEEFSVPSDSLDDAHLALQAEMHFALNAEAPQTAAQLAHRFAVSTDRMERVLEGMLQDRRILRVRQKDETLYHAGPTTVHGPNPREQRIRATHRTRIPSQPD